MNEGTGLTGAQIASGIPLVKIPVNAVFMYNSYYGRTYSGYRNRHFRGPLTSPTSLDLLAVCYSKEIISPEQYRDSLRRLCFGKFLNLDVLGAARETGAISDVEWRDQLRLLLGAVVENEVYNAGAYPGNTHFYRRLQEGGVPQETTRYLALRDFCDAPHMWTWDWLEDTQGLLPEKAHEVALRYCLAKLRVRIARAKYSQQRSQVSPSAVEKEEELLRSVENNLEDLQEKLRPSLESLERQLASGTL